MKRKLNWLVTLVAAVCVSSFAHAGDNNKQMHKAKHKSHSGSGHGHGHSREEELKYEISFLAKKLLDMSGEETITISQEAYSKPFLGVCSAVTPGGVQLTCITPGHSAEAAGLRTGDLVVEIDAIKMMAPSSNVVKKAYFGAIDKMKTGQKMSFTVYRGPDEKNIEVTVGELNQPGYTMTIRRR